jgi:hypothetical protein
MLGRGDLKQQTASTSQNTNNILFTHYTSLTDKQYNLCTINSDTTICPTLLLETNINHPSCLSSIWTGARVETLCEFDYMHKIKPDPQIIDTGTAILLSGLDTLWHLDCRDRRTHEVYNGPSYAVIKNIDICGCKILSETSFVEPHQTGCSEDRVNTFAPLHPITAAAATVFDDIATLSLDTLFNNSNTFKRAIPDINIKTSPDNDILDIADGDEHINHDRLREMIDLKEEIYLTKIDKLNEEANVESWFAPFDSR